MRRQRSPIAHVCQTIFGHREFTALPAAAKRTSPKSFAVPRQTCVAGRCEARKPEFSWCRRYLRRQDYSLSDHQRRMLVYSSSRLGGGGRGTGNEHSLAEFRSTSLREPLM